MDKAIRFRLNGKNAEIASGTGQTLLWVLRNHFGLTGTKFGCGSGFCGACSVIIDNEAVRSCTLPVSEVEGKEVITIEGLTVNGRLNPLQQAFVDHDALQCGFCTPGMIINATAMLMKNPSPSRQEIIDGMEDNLCRCGAHVRIIEAIETAAVKMKGGK
jgi:aerobic-type carbon monoxide dehydrogenase small subunit (CoxS/CutS family)